jgi:hypothetical protein
MDNKNEKYSQENGNMHIIPDNNQNKKPNLNIGTLNVFTKEHKVLGRSRKMRWISDSVLIFIIALSLFLGVSYLIRSYNIGKNIFLEARALSEKVSSGNLETFELDYKNNNQESIYGATIALEFPGNFILDKVLPADIFDPNTNTIDLGDLASGANGKIKISGYVLGEVDAQQFIKFSLNYYKDGFPRKCQNILAYLIEDSVLDFNLSLPTNLYQGVLFSDQLVLHNQGQRDLENIKIVLDKNIEIQNIDNFQGLSFDKNNIYLDKLKINEKIFLNLDLIVKNVQGQARISIISEANGFKQKDLEKEIFVEVPKFKVSILSDQKQMRAGEYLDFKIDYQNNEDDFIQNISLNLKPIVGFIIKDLKLKDQSRFTQDTYNIYFNDGLASKESGSLNIRVLLQRNKVELNQEAGLLASINYTYQNKLISYPASSSRVKICSSLNVESTAYYYSPQGDQLGAGPIPPMVDVPTNYWIFWSADNFGNNLSSLTMSADLPQGLVWTNNKSILDGNLQYGEISRRVIWTIDNISAQGGEYQAKFELGLIPEEKDIGQILDLLKNIKFSAQDDFCGVQISGTKEKIDTNLKDDNLSSGKGRVESFK